MSANTLHGSMNGPAAGIIMRDLATRAAHLIYALRHNQNPEHKVGYDGVSDDVATDGDKEAQKMYEKLLKECFPDYGIIAEENDLSIAPKNGCTAYFTVDPLDGTKAYTRQQSDGISTMIALCDKGMVIAAYVGDVNTSEIYGFRPGSSKVHRLSGRDGDHRVLERTEATKPGEFYALLRDPPEVYSRTTRRLLNKSGKVKGKQESGSSIGTWMAKLWKGEVSMAIIPPGYETPWDSSPVLGISQKMGFSFLKPKRFGGWQQFTPPLYTEKTHRNHDLLIVHERDVTQFI